jgi:hypothetical protein
VAAAREAPAGILLAARLNPLELLERELLGRLSGSCGADKVSIHYIESKYMKLK